MVNGKVFILARYFVSYIHSYRRLCQQALTLIGILIGYIYTSVQAKMQYLLTLLKALLSKHNRLLTRVCA